MKKLAMFGAFALVLAAVLSGGPSEAAITAKFVNKTDRTIYLAYASEGTTNVYTKGWYKIEPGKSWTFNAEGWPGWNTEEFHYYAEAKKKGGKPWKWGGDFKAPIHPTKSFDYPDKAPDGMINVVFGSIKNWKNSGEDGIDATGSVTFTAAN